ncbi:programmed cell death 1 ligand 1-like [Simochromis diagramma]|uniref:programmed cell death 1 ligand 1-like n=1 Tax=Simochromis diagramma TaxID=43689 RepID=UPI001A7E5C72|nr:programmed cell death 1 ligand 1-like [Simochromis diagramma]XP_039893179.1 programmed cell death 1 ligand 1-like [Simochromis diagramma]
MATSASLCCFMFLGVFVFVSADQEVISGQNVTLPCHANSKIPIIAVKWSRADLGEKYVLFYRDEQFVPVNQHPSFKNRVDLQDKEMKDGDVSLILKNVTINDAGTYECQVAQREPNQEIANLKIINTSKLSVVPPGQTRGHTEDGGKEAGSVGLKVGVTVFSLLFVVAVGFAV